MNPRTVVRERRLPSGMLELRMQLPAAHANARAARALVRGFVQRLGLRGKELARLLLIFDEMLSNAVDHGGAAAAMEREQALGTAAIGVVLRVDGRQWMLDVADRGEGNAAKLRQLLRSQPEIALESERGRGLMLLKDLADVVLVRQRPSHAGIVVSARRTWRAGPASH